MHFKTIRMEGIEAQDKRLVALGKAVVTNIADEAVGSAAQYLARAWVEVSPYDPRSKPKTRTLKSGERVTTDYGHGRDQIKAKKVKPRKATSVVWKVSTGDAFWLYIYEYGKFDQPARPTFRPATESARGTCMDLQKASFHGNIAAAWAGRPVNATGRNA